MADSNADEGLGVLCSAISDLQGKGRILKNSLDELYEELQRFAAVSEKTSTFTITKLPTLQAVLTDHLQMNRGDTEETVDLSHSSSKVLVLVADDAVATHVVDAVQPSYPTKLLAGTECANAGSLDHAQQVYVAKASDCLGSSASLESTRTVWSLRAAPSTGECFTELFSSP